MTYGTLFRFNSRQANQFSTRAFKRTLEFCGSRSATYQGLWDVHAPSVSIFTNRATAATTGRHSGKEDSVYCQVSPQCHCGPTATRHQPKDVFGRNSPSRHHRLFTGGRAAWLNGNSPSELSNWNIVLIASFSKNCYKPINCWYQKHHDRLIPIP